MKQKSLKVHLSSGKTVTGFVYFKQPGFTKYKQYFLPHHSSPVRLKFKLSVLGTVITSHVVFFVKGMCI
jgi:hypothetical protein